MNEKKLINIFYRQNQQRYELVAPNIYPDWQFKEMDILAIRKSGFVDEIEVKLTKSDYLNDFRKTVHIKTNQPDVYEEKLKHDCLREGLNHCNYFSFLMPENIAEKCLIPEHLGLYIFDGRWIREIRKPKRLHNRKIDLQLKYKIARSMTYRFWKLNNTGEKQ